MTRRILKQYHFLLKHRPFPSCLLPLCQNEFSCETIHMKMCSAYRFIFQKCSSSRKLVILFIVSSCYCFRARGIVSVVCSIVLSKSSKPFMWDLTRAATSPSFSRKSNSIWLETFCSRTYFEREAQGKLGNGLFLVLMTVGISFC